MIKQGINEMGRGIRHRPKQNKMSIWYAIIPLQHKQTRFDSDVNSSYATKYYDSDTREQQVRRFCGKKSDVDNRKLPRHWLPHHAHIHFTNELIYSSDDKMHTRLELEKEVHDESKGNPFNTCSVVVQIEKIPDDDMSHPARGQYGLFASADIPEPGTILLVYSGRVVNHASVSSYLLHLYSDRSTGTAYYVDAAECGNESRFINDFRGTTAGVPNVKFVKIFRPDNSGVVTRVNIVTLKPITRGEEILIDYGDSFWDIRS